MKFHIVFPFWFLSGLVTRQRKFSGWGLQITGAHKRFLKKSHSSLQTPYVTLIKKVSIFTGKFLAVPKWKQLKNTWKDIKVWAKGQKLLVFFVAKKNKVAEALTKEDSLNYLRRLFHGKMPVFGSRNCLRWNWGLKLWMLFGFRKLCVNAK